jgi:hypothetical protein
MTLATYSELVSEMGDWLNRADLSAKIPTFIRLFETRMNRRLRSPDMEQAFTQDTVAGTDTYALSSRVRQITSAYLTTDPVTNLTGMTPAVLRSSYPDSIQGQPQAYAVSGESLVLAPVPDGDYPLVYSGFATLSGLTAGNPTNWLLDDHPDAYLFGSLCMAEAYLQDDQRLNVWKAAWDEALGEIIREGNAKRLPGGPLVMQPTVIE